MKVHLGQGGYVHIDLSGAEAMVLLEELETVRGGARCVKLRQVCEGLKQSLSLQESMKPSNAATAQIERRNLNVAAVELGRQGGLKGGHARAESLTQDERSSIARKAAEARWGIKKEAPDDV